MELEWVCSICLSDEQHDCVVSVFFVVFSYFSYASIVFVMSGPSAAVQAHVPLAVHTELARGTHLVSALPVQGRGCTSETGALFCCILCFVTAFVVVSLSRTTFDYVTVVR